MNRMILAVQSFFRKIAAPPPPHPVVGEVERASELSIAESRKVDRRADEFSALIRGMRGERAGSRRAARRSR